MSDDGRSVFRLVIIERPDVWVVSSPDVPGTHAVAGSLAEAIELGRAAIVSGLEPVLHGTPLGPYDFDVRVEVRTGY